MSMATTFYACNGGSTTNYATLTYAAALEQWHLYRDKFSINYTER